MSKVLALLNSDRRSVRWATVTFSLLLGAALWESVGWSFNQAIMAPLIGGGDHPGTLPRLYVYIFEDEEYRLSFLQSAGLFSTGFALAVLVAVPLG